MYRCYFCTVVFVSGYCLYKKNPPKGNVLVKVFGVIIVCRLALELVNCTVSVQYITVHSVLPYYLHF